jgi:hypothetical protein
VDGREWLGRTVQQGAVLYVALERKKLVERRAIASESVMRFPMPYSLSSVGFLIFGIPRTWPAWWRPLGKSKTKPGKHWPSGLNTPAIQLACRVTFTGLLLAPDRLAKLELLGSSLPILSLAISPRSNVIIIRRSTSPVDELRNLR